MIQFEKIKKSFKVDFWKKENLVLDEISFEIKKENIVGFLGSNGAGKTTLIKILMGFIEANSGEIHIASTLGGKKNFLQNVGYLPERPYFYPHLTGQEFLSYLSGLSGVKRSTLTEKCHYWGTKLNILWALDRKITTYSKGMLQRLGLLSTLIHDPKLIILDEPLSGLDPIGRREIKDVILELSGQGKTLFFSSHIVPDIEEICHKIIFLHNRKVFFDGAPSDLVNKTVGMKYLLKLKCDPSQLQSLQLKNNIEQDLIKKVNDCFEIKLNEDNKEKVLSDAVNMRLNIIKFDLEKVGLEQIFYHLEKENRL